MESDKPENKPKNAQHSVTLLSVPDEKLMSTWTFVPKSPTALAAAKSTLAPAAKKINEGINKYNHGDITAEEFLDQYSPLYKNNDAFKGLYDTQKVRDYLKKHIEGSDWSSEGTGVEKKHNVPGLTNDQFVKEFGDR
jgi:hypothetical protein